ncbi:MAG TPA: polysaccharide biosynthesis C-terminal domain-containing protein [Ignavibacteriales bacterium]|nr:polysaccharide biosynthesis C-terminal domain-containing protein [Ignavibacteriales bacterium]
MREKFKELTKDTAVYGISTILSRFLTFILVPFYSHVLGKAENGIVGYIYAYIAFLNIIYLYGMDSAYLKYASLNKDEKNKKSVFSTPYIFVTLTSVIISLLIIIFRPQVNQAMDIPPGSRDISYYFTFILLFDSLAVIPFAHLRLIRKAKKFALIKTVNILVNVALNIILIRAFRLGMIAVFISNLAASVITLLLLVPDILKNLEVRIDKGLLKKMLKFGLPYLPASLASMVIQVIDRPILLMMTNESTVGVYQINYKLGIFMMLFVSMFQYAWQPFFLHNAKEENAKEIFSKVLTYFVFAGSVVLVLLSLFIGDLIRLHILGFTLIGAAYWSGAVIIPVVLLGYLFNGIYVNFTAGIFIEEKTKYLPYITGLGALINVGVNYLLIPRFGIMGAASATLASYVVMAIALFLVSQKFYKIDYEYGKLLRIMLSVLIPALVYYLVPINTLIFKFGVLLLYIVLLFSLRIINKKEVKALRRSFLPQRRTAGA